MAGWVPFDADDWPEVVEALASPWPEGAARFDLRWHADRGLKHGRPFWRARWGWTDWRVKTLLKSETWKDPIAKPPARRQPTASPPPADRQPDNGPRQETEQKPPADRQRTASEPPADRHARGDHPTQPPSPSQDPPCSPPEGDRADPPEWVRKWKRRNRAADHHSTRDLLNVSIVGLEGYRGKPLTRVPAAGEGRAVLNAWTRLGKPDPLRLGETCALLRRACQECPDPWFRDHVRGVRADGTRWKDKPRITPQVALRLDPPPTSTGATLEQRLEVAEEWAAAGYPLENWPPGQQLPAPRPRNDGRVVLFSEMFEAGR